MKNIIMGIIGCFLVIYTVALSLGVHSMYVRKNEIDNCVASVLESSMERYYEKNGLLPENNTIDNASVQNEIIHVINERLQADSDTDVMVCACDMEKGIISVKVKEVFMLPGGVQKEINCKKTIIVDKSIREN